ncbi:hypothetical protein myaer102_40590 [Microcystis viridis NIES-102]|uniref:Uncharacterized protein n=1 Tax=Microcystis viridis NIES-102 TaxID=213615 RepID=A0A3G9JLV1_MICVR|nr:hypothetical protein myaer102_40590 [Microcystis viridis NIES-102]
MVWVDLLDSVGGLKTLLGGYFGHFSPISCLNVSHHIAYSMDALIPGFYIWLGSFCWRLGGSDAEESYPGTIHSFAGISLVLPGYQIFTTYKGSYDPR